MESLLEKAKGIFKRDDPEKEFEALRIQADEIAMANAKRAGEDTFVPPEPTMIIKLASLKRWYYLVKKGSPDLKLEGKELLTLEPSGLTPRELNQWYWGIRGEAAHRFIVIMNGSYSKSAMEKHLIEEGLEDARLLLNQDERECCEEVIKYISD